MELCQNIRRKCDVPVVIFGKCSKYGITSICIHNYRTQHKPHCHYALRLTALLRHRYMLDVYSSHCAVFLLHAISDCQTVFSRDYTLSYKCTQHSISCLYVSYSGKLNISFHSIHVSMIWSHN